MINQFMYSLEHTNTVIFAVHTHVASRNIHILLYRQKSELHQEWTSMDNMAHAHSRLCRKFQSRKEF
jgi:hypothetical protein